MFCKTHLPEKCWNLTSFQVNQNHISGVRRTLLPTTLVFGHRTSKAHTASWEDLWKASKQTKGKLVHSHGMSWIGKNQLVSWPWVVQVLLFFAQESNNARRGGAACWLQNQPLPSLIWIFNISPHDLINNDQNKWIFHEHVGRIMEKIFKRCHKRNFSLEQFVREKSWPQSTISSWPLWALRVLCVGIRQFGSISMAIDDSTRRLTLKSLTRWKRHRVTGSIESWISTDFR